MRFTTDLILRRKRQETAGHNFYVERLYWIEHQKAGEWHRYYVPKGYGTDLASVPVGFRNIASKVDAVEASVIHDHAYETRTMPRAEADRLFLEIMEASGIGWVKRNLMYSAVRMGGWVIWNRHDGEFATEGEAR